MNVTRIIVVLCFAALLGVPLLVPGRAGDEVSDAARTLIIISPHNEQIRWEFGRGFERWHEQEFGEPVRVIWNRPGGTSEIRRMLIAQYTAALRDGRPVGGAADLMMGGGSYEFTRLSEPITIDINGETRTTTITAKLVFDQQWLDDVYGENRITNSVLYDPDGFWFGTALSGFGIVYNRDVLDELELPVPTVWADLSHPKLRGWVALVNPAQSGSITTALETILLRMGWTDGWRVLRRCGANARYFSASSIKPPLDVSQGDAAAGICIDFYGRYQAQSVKEAGGGDRLGYVDPPGLTTIDPDPIAMLNGARDPELARRFIEYSLSERAQALWQFPIEDDVDDDLGPTRFELRRLPIRRSMYEKYRQRMIDDVDPFALGTPIANLDRNYRSFVAVLFTAMAMDSHHELAAAWKAIVQHPAYPHGSSGAIVTADMVSDLQLRRMLEIFDAMPTIEGPDGAIFDLADPAVLGLVKAGWLRGGWADAELWPKAAKPADVLRRRFGGQFREHYRQIVEITNETPAPTPLAVGRE